MHHGRDGHGGRGGLYTWELLLVFEDDGLGFGGIGVEMNEGFGEIDPDAGAAGAEQSGDDFEELLGGGEADIQSLAPAFRIGCVSAIGNPAHGVVVLGAATA